MFIIGDTLAAGVADDGSDAGWLFVTLRSCDDDDSGVAVYDDVGWLREVSTVGVSLNWDVAAVDDDGDEAVSDFSNGSDLGFFGRGASSVSW